MLHKVLIKDSSVDVWYNLGGFIVIIIITPTSNCIIIYIM